LFSLPNIIKEIDSMWMGLAGHVARMWNKRNAYK